MLSSRSARGVVVIAAAITLAACGSDNAAGPTTDNNAQIIADMQPAFERASDSGNSMRASLLEYAITSLSIGSPVNSGNVVIDGTSHPFSFTSFSVETLDSAGTSLAGLTIVAGWRHSNGDSVVALIYGSDDAVLALRSAGDDARQPADARSLRLAGVTRMIRGARVSQQLSGGNYTLLAMGFVTADEGWEAGYGVGSELSGSAALSPVAGECDSSGMDDAFGGENIECRIERGSISAQGNLVPFQVEEGDDSMRSFSVPSQSVTGARVLVTLPGSD